MPTEPVWLRSPAVRLARHLVVVATVAVMGIGGVTSCGADGGPTPDDPVLAQGQQLYRQYCASCHGPKGGGGSGPRLAGLVEERYPDIEDQIALIANGRAGMPGFGQRLSAEELRAVARYEREALGE